MSRISELRLIPIAQPARLGLGLGGPLEATVDLVGAFVQVGIMPVIAVKLIMAGSGGGWS